MNKVTALERLGLTGAEDPATVALAYGRKLATVQEQLVTASTDAERVQHQSTLSGLVEAYQFLTHTEPLARARSEDSHATLMRDSAATPAPSTVQDAFLRMETGAVLSSRLEIGAMLGQGGMGYVYAAHDRLRDEDVAIKVLRQDLIFSTAAKERFLAEAKLSSNLSHPNIVRVYDVGESGGHYYLSMERLFGHTLRQRIEAYRQEKRPFSLAETTDIVRQLIEALRYAHRFIVHRDLKPENVWLADDGTVKLMDFGIARAFSTSHMTQTGMTLGTAYYMAPEQRLDAKEVDWRADQYALGVMMYELLAGTIPMGAVTPLDQVRPDVPPRYANAVMRAMSPKPENRWPSLAELQAELEAPAVKSSKAAVWLILGLGLAAAAAGGAYFMRGTREPSQVATAPLPAATLPSAKTGPAETGTPPPSDQPSESAPPAQSGAEPGPVASEARSETPAPPPAIAPPTAKQPAFLQPEGATPVQLAAVAGTDDAARRECIAQCERDDGQCRSINRRGRQDCLRTVGFGAGGGGGLSIAPGSQNSACAFFTEDRCRLAPDRDECVQRTRTRQEQCVTVRGGSFASGVQGCDVAAREGENMCLAQLRDCRTYCD